MQRRPYTDSDLARLQAAVAGWIAQGGPWRYDHIGELPHRIYENLRGRRPTGDLVHIWESDSTVVGVAICARFGSAFDLVLAPPLRGTAVERELLAWAADTTARFLADGGDFVSTDVFASDEPRQDALQALGFERFRVWDDLVQRRLDAPVDSIHRSGFVVRSARLDDASRLAQVHSDAFPDSEPWTGEEYRAEVMEKPGYDPGREIVAEAPDGRLAAFTVYWLDLRNRTGHLEPVGTHPDYRQLGLASAVVTEAMARMRATGMQNVDLTHNADNLPAHRLYESLGFEACDVTFGWRRAVGS